MNRKRWIIGACCLAAGLCLTLCGCGPTTAQENPTPTAEITPSPLPSPTPTPEPSPTPELTWEPEIHYDPDFVSHDTYTIDVGDGKHIFRLEAVSEGLWGEFERDLTLSIYEGEGQEPVQVFEEGVGVGPSNFSLYIEDVDFDGCMDFYYLYSQGIKDSYYSFYIWDAEEERFVKDPYDLNGLSSPGFDPEKKTISECSRGGFYEDIMFYRYERKELTPVRKLGFSGPGVNETVYWMGASDWVDGEWKEVFRIEGETEDDWDWTEYFRWHDLDYHGQD